MTQQYIAGELSLRLGELQAVAADTDHKREITHLRHDAETTPAGALRTVAERALRLADHLCWISLDLGDTSAFCRQATIGADLCEFGICAGLLQESLSADNDRGVTAT